MSFKVTSHNLDIYVRCECGRYLTFSGSLTEALKTSLKCECGNSNAKYVLMSREDFIKFERNKKIEQLNENNVN